MKIRKLENWLAKRSGGAITIHATDCKTKKPVRITGIDSLVAVAGKPSVATAMTGERYHLVS